MRLTSIESYKTLLNQGIITQKQLQVISLLQKTDKPVTAGELFQISTVRKLGLTVVKGSVSARLSELESMGVVSAIGTKTCGLTGHTAIAWVLTNKLPKQKIPHRRKFFKISFEQLKKAVAHLADAEMTDAEITNQCEQFIELLRQYRV